MPKLIGDGWPIYPVGLAVGNPVEPLNDWDVNLISPVNSQRLRCQFLESWIIASQRAISSNNLSYSGLE